MLFVYVIIFFSFERLGILITINACSGYMYLFPLRTMKIYYVQLWHLVIYEEPGSQKSRKSAAKFLITFSALLVN